MPRSSPPRSAAPSSRPLVLPALIAAAITFLAFLPALTAGFVNWDDDLNFLMNPHYRGLGPKHLAWMFTTFHMGPYQPLSWLTLGLDYTLWNMAPAGYHFTSLLLHAVNAALCVLVAGALLEAAAPGDEARPGRIAASLFAGLVFAVHPLRVESVAWITERRDVVSGLFFLLMLLAYLRAAAIDLAGGNSTKTRIAAFVFFMMSLFGKATGVTAPIVLLVLDVVPLRRLPASPRRWFEKGHRGILLEKLPYLAVAFVFGVVALIGQKEAGGLKDVATFTVTERAGLTAYASAFYLLKIAAPWNLSPLYELRGDFSVTSPPVVIAGLCLLGITILVGALARRLPALPAAWIAWLVMIAPVSGVARAGNQLAADRYTYIAALPFAFLAGAAWLRLDRAARPAVRVAGVLVILVLAGLTFAQARIWHDSISLWTHAVGVDPGGERAAMNLASAYVDAERYDDAEALYRKKIAADPSHADARYSLGMVLLRTGRTTEAERTFRDLIRDRPDFAMGHYGLGILEMQRGNKVVAREALREALRLEPSLARARQALADLGE